MDTGGAPGIEVCGADAGVPEADVGGVVTSSGPVTPGHVSYCAPEGTALEGESGGEAVGHVSPESRSVDGGNGGGAAAGDPAVSGIARADAKEIGDDTAVPGTAGSAGAGYWGVGRKDPRDDAVANDNGGLADMKIWGDHSRADHVPDRYCPPSREDQ